MYDYLFFDLDGTLTDSYDGITNSIMYALERLGISGYEKADMLPFVGPPLFESFAIMTKGDPDLTEKGVKLYREYYAEEGWAQNSVYDGVIDMLKALKEAGKKMAVATSKPEPFAVRIVEKFGLDKYFEFTAGASFDTSRAQKSDVLRYAVDRLGADKARSVMIGDRKHDVIGAKTVGLDAIGVLYGYGDRDELVSAGAKKIAAFPHEIIDLV